MFASGYEWIVDVPPGQNTKGLGDVIEQGGDIIMLRYADQTDSSGNPYYLGRNLGTGHAWDHLYAWGEANPPNTDRLKYMVHMMSGTNEINLQSSYRRNQDNGNYFIKCDGADQKGFHGLHLSDEGQPNEKIDHYTWTVEVF